MQGACQGLLIPTVVNVTNLANLPYARLRASQSFVAAAFMHRRGTVEAHSPCSCSECCIQIRAAMCRHQVPSNSCSRSNATGSWRSLCKQGHTTLDVSDMSLLKFRFYEPDLVLWPCGRT